MKKLYILMWLAAFAFTGQAQTLTIPAANPTGTTDRRPLASWWGYERSASIYQSSEINAAGSITSIAFYVEKNDLPAGTIIPTKIFLKNTTASTLTSTTVATEQAGAVLVFDAPVTISNATVNNWYTITLTTPYSYTGSGNLEVITETNFGGTGVGSSTDLYFRHSAVGANRFQHWSADNSAPTGTGTLSGNRPNIRLGLAPSQPNDIAITAITSPTSGCGLTGQESICITVNNFGTAAQSNIPVSFTVNGGSPVNEIIAGPLASGASINYCFTAKTNMAAAGTYNIAVQSNLTGDGNTNNNSVTKAVVGIPSISTFPYSQNFENGAGGWISGGSLSTWALGTPAKSPINSAASGTKAWVTSLTGDYNDNENSFVVGPCFNFSSIPDPDFEMKIWWDAESSFDGAVLQSSTDGGLTWRNVGNVNEPNNWYNDSTISGNPGSQQKGWSGDGSDGSGGWVTAKHRLNGLGGQSSVLLRIAFGADGSQTSAGFAFDDIRIGDNSNNLAINAFVPLSKICGFGNNENVEVILENQGSIPASGYTVSYTVNNGTTTTPAVTAQGSTLAPGIATNFLFQTGANLSNPGAYVITVTVNMPGDPDASNNTFTYNVNNAAYTSLPPVLNFETSAIGMAGLRTMKGTKANLTEAAGASIGTGSTKGLIMDGVTHPNWVIPVATTNPWNSNPDNFSAAYLCFNPAGGNQNDPLWLSFDLKQLYKGANANTNFRVTINGTPVGGNQATPANTYRPPFSGTGGTTNWTKVYIDLTPFKNEPTIQIGFESSVKEEYANGTGTANLVDNIRIQRLNPTGINHDILNSQLQVFPNPSAGIFNVTLPQGKAFEMEVTDLTGKVVMQQAAKTGAAKLDLSKAAKGVYLLKVSAEGASSVQRIIVE